MHFCLNVKIRHISTATHTHRHTLIHKLKGSSQVFSSKIKAFVEYIQQWTPKLKDLQEGGKR